jgi:hypothetical protein
MVTQFVNAAMATFISGAATAPQLVSACRALAADDAAITAALRVAFAEGSLTLGQVGDVALAMACTLAEAGYTAAPAAEPKAKRQALPAHVTLARAAARQVASKAAMDAAGSGTLLAWAASLGCAPEAMPDGRMGVRKYRLEAAMHKHYGDDRCEDNTGHYLCGITEALGRSPLVDSHRIETKNEAGQVRASTWYADRAGEAGVRVGGYTRNRKAK